MIASLLAALLVQTAAPACTATAAPPAGLEAWSRPIELSGILGFSVGAATKIPLSNAALPIAPERPAAAGTFSQVLGFRIEKVGTYRVALSAGAWIDVVRDGKPLTSTAHMEGAACSGIRKIVDFDLAPGTYTLQLSGAKVQEMTVLIAPK